MADSAISHDDSNKQDSPGMVDPGERYSVAALFGIVLLGTALRLYGLDAKSLWYDEAVSWQTLNFSIPDLVERKSDVRSVHPPFYFLLLQPWSALFGESEFALRSLAALFGILAIAGTYLFVRALWTFPPRETESAPAGPALFAAALVALSPIHILNSQQVRGYSLATALLMWCGWSMLCGLRPQSSQRYMLLVSSLLAVALCYTNHVAVMSAGALAAFALPYLWFRRRESPIPYKWVSAAALIFVVIYIIPWFPRFVHQAENVRQSTYFARPFDLIRLPVNISRVSLATWAARPSKDHFEVWTVTIALFALLLYLGVGCRWKGYLLAVTGILPVFMIVAFSYMSSRTIITARYFTFAHIMWLCAISYVICRIPHRSGRWMLVAWSLGNSVFLCSANWSAIGRSHSSGLREASHVIQKHRKDDERVITTDHRAFYGLKYYLRNRGGGPLFCVANGNRDTTRGAEHLADEDFINVDAVMASRTSGLWIITTEHNAVYSRLISRKNCVRIKRWTFRSDYFWEPQIAVEHYRIR